MRRSIQKYAKNGYEKHFNLLIRIIAWVTNRKKFDDLKFIETYRVIGSTLIVELL